MGRHLFENLRQVGAKVAAAPSIEAYLDFDGTLTPLTEAPGAAMLSASMRGLLADLSLEEDVTVAILSGRERADLIERVGVEQIIYAGNHGLEISGSGLLFIEPAAAAHEELLHGIGMDLASRLEPITGAMVEDKGLTLSVHLRQVEPGRKEDARRCVHATLGRSSHPFVLAERHEILNIWPRCRWDKGAALNWIHEQAGRPGGLAIRLGDDVSDEDAFLSAHAGVTIKVGEAEPTAAHYFLRTCLEVQAFLGWLLLSIRKRVTRRKVTNPLPMS